MADGSELSGPALAREKANDYRNTVILQVVLFLVVLLLEDMSRLVGFPLNEQFLEVLFHLMVAVYMGLLWDMLRNFTRQRWVSRAVLATLIGAFFTLFVLDVFLGKAQFEAVGLRLFCHFAIFSVEMVTIVFAINDLFRGPRTAVDKLWGSACIYFMSALAFTSVYYSVLLINPLAFGRELSADSWALFEALYLSLNSLVGLDTVYPDSIRLVRNLVLTEGVWSELYMVLLIGRLLTKEDDLARSSQEKG